MATARTVTGCMSPLDAVALVETSASQRFVIRSAAQWLRQLGEVHLSRLPRGIASDLLFVSER